MRDKRYRYGPGGPPTSGVGSFVFGIAATGQPPANTAAPSISPTGYQPVGTTLTTNPGTWTGSPTFTYQWFRGGAPIAGQTTTTYQLQAGDHGTSIHCIVSATNANGTTTASTQTVQVAYIPSNTALPAVTPTTGITVGTSLSCSTGTWANSPTSYSYQWYRGGNFIPGETASTYTVQAGDSSTTMYCAVTATNAAGSSLATSNTVNVPAFAVPPAPVITVASGTDVQTIGAEWVPVSANPIVTQYRLYFEQGTTVSLSSPRETHAAGTNNPHTFVTAFLNTFDTLYTIAATAINSIGESVLSNTMQVRTCPQTPVLNSLFGGFEQVTMNWGAVPGAASYTLYYVNQTTAGTTQVITGVTGVSRAITGLTAGNVYRFWLKAVGSTGSISSSSNSMTTVPSALPLPLNNVAPAVTPTTLQPRGTVYTCDTGTWEPIYGPYTYTYQWFRDAIPRTGFTANTYTSAQDDEGRVISCQVFARNTTGAVGAMSNDVTIPHAPAYLNVAPQITPAGTPALADMLTTSTGTWDASQGTLNYEYAWYRGDSPNPVAVAGETTNTYQIKVGDTQETIASRVKGCFLNWCSPTAQLSGNVVVAPMIRGPQPTLSPATTSWIDASWTNQATADSYRLYWAYGSTVNSSTGTAIIPAFNSQSITGLSLPNTVSVTMVSVDSRGNRSADSVTTTGIFIEYLLVGGGGGGGARCGGGGGAGRFYTGIKMVSAGTQYNVTIGTGGVGGAADQSAPATNGGNSIFDNVTMPGGGAGGTTLADSWRTGSSGGSGGGATDRQAGTSVPGSGFAGQGNGGGLGGFNNPYYAGGGGGATQVGFAGSVAGANRSKGGDGAASSITGTSVVYAGGGGGGYYMSGGETSGASLGGSGGGGRGTKNNTNMGTAGVDGTGGGGGGGGQEPAPWLGGFRGGNGVLIIACANTNALNISAGLTYTLDTVGRPGVRVYTITAGTGTVSLT